MKFKGKIRLYYSDALCSLVNQEEIIYNEPITNKTTLNKYLVDMKKEAERRYHMKSYYLREMSSGNYFEKQKKIKELEKLKDNDLLDMIMFNFMNNKEIFKIVDINKDIEQFTKQRNFEIHNHIGSEDIPPYEFNMKDYFIDKIADIMCPIHYLNIDYGSHFNFIIVEFEEKEDFYKYVTS